MGGNKPQALRLTSALAVLAISASALATAAVARPADRRALAAGLSKKAATGEAAGKKSGSQAAGGGAVLKKKERTSKPAGAAKLSSATKGRANKGGGEGDPAAPPVKKGAPDLIEEEKSRGPSYYSLADLIAEAKRQSRRAASLSKRAEAEQALSREAAAPEDPVAALSLMNHPGKSLADGSLSAAVSQKIQFPIKYYLQSKERSARAQSLRFAAAAEAWLVREKAVFIYYSIYCLQKIIQLTKAAVPAVREFARSAENKYAAGKRPQADSMKAHFELTRLRLKLTRLEREETSFQARLQALVPKINPLSFEEKTLPVPKFLKAKAELKEKAGGFSELALKDSSPVLKKEAKLEEAASYRRRLAKWGFAPDFHIQYRRHIKGRAGAPLMMEGDSFSFGMSLPLYFWKQSAKAGAAEAYEIAQELKAEDAERALAARVKDLKNQALAGAKILKIYQTGLIPQAKGAYRSARAAYRADKIPFLSLLDSERALYQSQEEFYLSLKDFVQALVRLESGLGFVVSDIEQAP